LIRSLLKLENAEYDLSGCAKCQLATLTTVNTNWIGYRSMRSVGRPVTVTHHLEFDLDNCAKHYGGIL